ncbi:hypothetical protein R5R35_014449 [Gryllus longicercus]|uniref:Phosphatidate cytidylyltransferase, mitochondrial n=1 Tax=Gryllus longicercus TaxID=2509291 RepID=A0AAN9Z188_9ORTH
MIVNKALIGVSSTYVKLLSLFPQNITLCFAYGSGVMKQSGQSTGKRNMIDLVIAVEDPYKWHEQNILWNPHHYSSLRWFGHNFVASYQENWGAKMYFNTLIKLPDSDTMIKYGVISRASLVTDLLDWNDLYVSGRLHKPVEILHKSSNTQVRAALQQNLHSAVHASLLLLPESFTETDLYRAITGLSYGGDFRMIFGEDKNKIDNIVSPQVESFRELYSPVLKSLQDYVEMSKDGQMCWQDTSPGAKNFHLNQLPKVPQRAVVKQWNKDRGSRRHDTEDSLYALAHDPECGHVVCDCLHHIVFASSARQSLKGILTAGLAKSVRYSSKKIVKMLKSTKL